MSAVLSGYVMLNEATITDLKIYTAASGDISEYTVWYVSRPSSSENNYVDLSYSFEAGKTYTTNKQPESACPSFGQ
ncbi:MAG: hypothetical protein II821_02580 [Treponema sp.]|nr:hypothetical protein [Treponema sp.]